MWVSRDTSCTQMHCYPELFSTTTRVAVFHVMIILSNIVAIQDIISKIIKIFYKLFKNALKYTGITLTLHYVWKQSCVLHYKDKLSYSCCGRFRQFKINQETNTGLYISELDSCFKSFMWGYSQSSREWKFTTVNLLWVFWARSSPKYFVVPSLVWIRVAKCSQLWGWFHRIWHLDILSYTCCNLYICNIRKMWKRSWKEAATLQLDIILTLPGNVSAKWLWQLHSHLGSVLSAELACDERETLWWT